MGDGTLKSVGTIVVLIFPDSIIYWPIFRKFIQILSNTKFEDRTGPDPNQPLGAELGAPNRTEPRFVPSGELGRPAWA